jgi:hypothetical protein
MVTNSIYGVTDIKAWIAPEGFHIVNVPRFHDDTGL